MLLQSRGLGVCGAVVVVGLMGCRQGEESSETRGERVERAKSELSAAAIEAASRPPEPEWTAVDDALPGPIWLGNDDRGTVFAPLFRGAFPGIEDYVFAPANGDCTKTKATIRVDWDRAANTVHFLVKGIHFPIAPDIHRTEGVDWYPNPYHADPKDIHGGSYRLWILLGSTTSKANFYYDPSTLKLLGSDLDFVGHAPPAGAIASSFPIFSTTGSSEFDPRPDGTIRHEFTLAYDGVTNESRTFSRAFASFVPLDLCEALPLQPAKSQLRPYVSPWQPPNLAPVWSDMLHAGIGFDVQIDERVSLDNGLGGNLPYIFSGISVAGNFLGMQGGVPRGWGNQILAAIQNVAPVIAPVPFGDGLGCRPYVHEGNHVSAPRYCEQHAARTIDMSATNGKEATR